MKSDETKVGDAQKTTDSFANFAARIGVSPFGFGSGNNLLSQGFYELNLVTRNRVQLEAAYRGSWIVGQVIDTIAEDMTRAGIDMNTNDGAEKLPEFKVLMSRLKIWDSLREDIQWGRLYGGAIGVLQIKGQDVKTPIDLDTVAKGQFQGIVVYDRWQLNPSLQDLINSGPDMGLPKYYDIVLGSNLNDPGRGPTGKEANTLSGFTRVHHSRCIRMDGIRLPFFQAITEQMWGESVLERMWDRLIAFDTATMGAGSLITRAQLRTVGIDGLREILAAGGPAQQALIEMFAMMRQLQSNEGITLLDKNDVFTSTAYSFAGLSDVLMQFGQQVSGASQIPLVRLFGQSPAGMSATGESDIRLYYDTINAKQEATLRNAMEMVLKVMWRSMTGEALPDDFSFTFTPLWQMSALDKATIAKTNTDTILEAHSAGLIDNATAMNELKQISGASGIFTHISDEAIKEAENDEPPTPESVLDPSAVKPDDPDDKTGDPGAGPSIPKSKDSAWRRFTASWFPPQKPIPVEQFPPIVKVKDSKPMSEAQKKILAFIGE
jgi:phage-related protein (TIGR01555 family)